MSGKKFLADINMDGNKISNVANPTQSGDVATFDWVNDIIDGQESIDDSIESRVVSIISNDTVEIDSITEIVQIIQSNEMALDGAISSIETQIQNISGPTGPAGATGPTGPQATSTNTTGTVINFTSLKIWNTPSSPATGNITVDLTDAQLGYIQKIYHNNSSSPTFPSSWVRLGSNTYTTSTLNIIYAEWVSGTRVEYWIVR